MLRQQPASAVSHIAMHIREDYGVDVGYIYDKLEIDCRSNIDVIADMEW